MNDLIAITPTPARLAWLLVNLSNNTPGSDASREDCADWYDEKAVVLDLLAKTVPAQAAVYQQRADTSRVMAAEYRQAGV